MNTHHSNQSKVELLSESAQVSTRLPPKKDYAAALAHLQSKYGAEASFITIPSKERVTRDARLPSTVTATQANSSQQTLVEPSPSATAVAVSKTAAPRSQKQSGTNDKSSLRRPAAYSEGRISPVSDEHS